jgi:hypothetical protein
MQNIRTVIGVALAILSTYMLYSGFSIFITTSGVVQGSEFGMLITLAHELSQLMLWLALFALWHLTSMGTHTSSQPTGQML